MIIKSNITPKIEKNLTQNSTSKLKYTPPQILPLDDTINISGGNQPYLQESNTGHGAWGS